MFYGYGRKAFYGKSKPLEVVTGSSIKGNFFHFCILDKMLDKLIPVKVSRNLLFGLQKACHICLLAEIFQAQLALLPSTSYVVARYAM